MPIDYSENDHLWNLLGKAKSPVRNPFFARNVLRKIRQGEPAPLLPISLLRWIRGVVLVCFTAAFIFTLNTSNAPLTEVEQVVFDSAAHIEELTESQDITFFALLPDTKEPFLIY